ncbi:unnamed protein product [Thelazia callipaeda]|uniref:CUB domain-containing protein n=1 Tax=Thelazia callipaeda TaxID=103827 RepID=A0A0N5CQC8_THECL|nr:unnamed protein product [Thelazia callipaeda]
MATVDNNMHMVRGMYINEPSETNVFDYNGYECTLIDLHPHVYDYSIRPCLSHLFVRTQASSIFAATIYFLDD